MSFSRVALMLALVLTVLALSGQALRAQDTQGALAGQQGPRAAPTRKVEVHQLPVMDSTPQFDADAATAKYLSRVSGAARAKSDAYFEGGYGLQLLDLLWGLGVAAALLWLGLSTRLRDWAAER